MASNPYELPWTNEDHLKATTEGWLLTAVFNSERVPDGYLEIEKLDVSSTFTSDAEAVAFVKQRATEATASDIYAKALSLVGKTLLF